VLISCNIANSSLISIRFENQHQRPEHLPHWLSMRTLILLFNFVAFVMALVLAVAVDCSSVSHCTAWRISVLWMLFIVVLSVLMRIFYVVRQFPRASDPLANEQYRVGWVPLIPMVGIIINYWLVAQQDWFSIGLTAAYLGICTVCYICYAPYDTRCEWKADIMSKHYDSIVPTESKHGLVDEAHDIGNPWSSVCEEEEEEESNGNNKHVNNGAGSKSHYKNGKTNSIFGGHNNGYASVASVELATISKRSSSPRRSGSQFGASEVHRSGSGEKSEQVKNILHAEPVVESKLS
jgi:hypothetical protein